jgi:hypothetical protein
METFSNFLKFSSPLDWLTIFTAAILILVGLIILIAFRRRTAIYVLLVLATVPLVLGLLTTYLKNRDIERMLSTLESVGVEAAEAGRREAMISTYVGAAGTIIVELIGVIGLVFKRGTNN